MISKKIDPQAFQANEQPTYEGWSHEFQQMHEKSFTAQKLFLINKIRRRYLLKVVESTIAPSVSVVGEVKVAKPSKPIMRPKIN